MGIPIRDIEMMILLSMAEPWIEFHLESGVSHDTLDGVVMFVCLNFFVRSFLTKQPQVRKHHKISIHMISAHKDIITDITITYNYAFIVTYIHRHIYIYI